jgi:hypothetical protein
MGFRDTLSRYAGCPGKLVFSTPELERKLNLDTEDRNTDLSLKNVMCTA